MAKKQKPTGRGRVLTQMAHHVAFAISSELEHNRLTLEEGVAVLASGICEVVDTLADISDKDYKQLRQHLFDYISTLPKM